MRVAEWGGRREVPGATGETPRRVEKQADDQSSNRADASAWESRWWELAVAVVAPWTVVSAFLVYFGWVQTSAFYGYFGVTQGVLGLSTVEYLLQSTSLSFRPLAFLVLTGLGGGLLLSSAQVVLRGRVGAQRSVAAGLGVLAVGAVTGATVVMFRDAPTSEGVAFNAAFALAIGIVVFEFSMMLGFAQVGTRRPWIILRRTLGGVLLVIAVFWGTTLYAQASGRAAAVEIDVDPLSRPGVVVRSSEDLSIVGPGVTGYESDPKGGDRAFPFQYVGLRLLVHADDRWFLLPVEYNQSDLHAVIVVSDSPSVRVDFIPPG